MFQSKAKLLILSTSVFFIVYFFLFLLLVVLFTFWGFSLVICKFKITPKDSAQVLSVAFLCKKAVMCLTVCKISSIWPLIQH